MEKEIVVIFGGTGFIGKDIARKLLKKGLHIKIFSKSPEKANELKTNASLGQLESNYIDITNQEQINAAITGADIVINLVGKKSGSAKEFFITHTLFPKLIAKAVKTLGIKKFIHFSTLGVDKIYDSRYAHSKYEGDQCLHMESRRAVIVRPSLVFGQHDHFLYKLYYSSLNYPIFPITAQNTETKPVYIGDVSKAVIEILENYDSYKGKIVDLVGDESYSMKDILEMIQTSIGKKINFISLPNGLYRSYVLLSRFSSDHIMNKEHTHLLRCNHKSDRNLFEKTLKHSVTLESFINSLSKSEKACEE